MAELSYNAQGEVRTLVGNWQEEQELKGVTGTARCKLTIAGAAGGRYVTSSAVVEPTFDRVVKHTDCQDPKGWRAHNMDSFQIPNHRIDLLSYPKVLGCGPRQAQELQQLMAKAAELAPAQVQEASWETTNQADFCRKDMEGLQVGCKVMKPDGSPADRDPVFLQEMGLMTMPVTGRLMARKAGEQGITKPPSLGYVHGSSATAISGLTSSSVDPAVPITMYTEAAAKLTYNGTFYGTATLGKGLMSRNDQFTKLMSDINKEQGLL